MEIVWKAAAGILLTVIIGIFLSRKEKDISAVLSIAACCMVFTGAAVLLRPVLGLLEKLQKLGNLNSNMVEILLKAAGIGLVSEISAAVCKDAGNTALAKAMQVLASAAVLWLSIPLMNSLLELLQKIMGEI